MILNKNVLATLVPAMMCSAAIADDFVDIPDVPSSVMRTGGSTVTEDGEAIHNEPVITVKQGNNYIVPVAVAHPNRIVTPFSNPEVISTSLTGMKADGSCSEICVKDNVVYVATNKTVPVTMFINEKGNESASISLTLVPKKIPPKEITLRFANQNQFLAHQTGSKEAAAWEQDQPYVETLKKLLRSVALNEIPSGYTVHNLGRDTADTPICRSDYVQTSFENGQLLKGHSFNLYIGVVSNNTGSAVEINEQMCGSWDVVAVAAFPNVVLHPGQKTEIYVVKRVKHEEKIKNFRPSLVGR